MQSCTISNMLGIFSEEEYHCAENMIMSLAAELVHGNLFN